MPSGTPQNSEEAAYISYALLDALLDLLISKGILSQGELSTLFDTAAASLTQSPNPSGKRGAEFLRQPRLGYK